MAEIEGALGREFQSLSIAFVCAFNTKQASLFDSSSRSSIYMELILIMIVVGCLSDYFKSATSQYFWRFDTILMYNSTCSFPKCSL